MSNPRIIIERLLAEADIAIDDPRPWDMKVHDGRFFSRVLTGGSLALGESYMDGWWDCPALDEMCTRAIGARSTSGLREVLAISLPCLGHSCSTSKRGGAP